MKRLLLLVLLAAQGFCFAQGIITLQPTQYTRAWFISGDSNDFARLDSFILAGNRRLSINNNNLKWYYVEKTAEDNVTVYRDTLHGGYLIKYSGRFINFDAGLAVVFPTVAYYQDVAQTTPNPYAQNKYILKAGRNLMATGVVGLVAIPVSIVAALTNNVPVRYVCGGLAFVGNITSIITYFSAAKNLTLAGKSRFR